jgi:hypothetical protein
VLFVDLLFGAVRPVGDQRQLDRAGVVGQPAGDDRDIALVDVASLERRTEPALRVDAAREDDQAEVAMSSR